MSKLKSTSALLLAFVVAFSGSNAVMIESDAACAATSDTFSYEERVVDTVDSFEAKCVEKPEMKLVKCEKHNVGLKLKCSDTKTLKKIKCDIAEAMTQTLCVPKDCEECFMGLNCVPVTNIGRRVFGKWSETKKISLE